MSVMFQSKSNKKAALPFMSLGISSETLADAPRGFGCSHHGAVQVGRCGSRRHLCVEVVATIGRLAFTLRLAEHRQQSAQLRHADGAVVSVAVEEVLEHPGRKLLLTRRLSRNWARRAKQGRQGQQGKQGEEDMMAPDEHDSSTGRWGRICGSGEVVGEQM